MRRSVELQQQTHTQIWCLIKAEEDYIMAATNNHSVLINMEELLQALKNFETRRLEVGV